MGSRARKLLHQLYFLQGLAKAKRVSRDISRKRYIEKEFGYDLSRKIEEIRETYSFDGSCQGTVPESIICFLEGIDAEDTIRNAISLGGDADTMGAIAGSIAEAYWKEDLSEMVKPYLPDDLYTILSSIKITQH